MTQADRRKVKALMSAAELLESGRTPYRWSRVESCNCGILAQVVLGISAAQLALRMSGYSAYHWSQLAQDFPASRCEISSLPIATVFSALYLVGFSSKELGAIENLDDGEIWKAMRGPNATKQDRTQFSSGLVAQYFRTMASMLQRKGRK
jgi:hypothetical protein